MCFKIMQLKFLKHLPGGNELSPLCRCPCDTLSCDTELWNKLFCFFQCDPLPICTIKCDVSNFCQYWSPNSPLMVHYGTLSPSRFLMNKDFNQHSSRVVEWWKSRSIWKFSKMNSTHKGLKIEQSYHNSRLRTASDGKQAKVCFKEDKRLSVMIHLKTSLFFVFCNTSITLPSNDMRSSNTTPWWIYKNNLYV